jgi:S-adenosylmethionine decarboxylase
MTSHPYTSQYNGCHCAGIHLLLNIYHAQRLNELDYIAAQLDSAVEAAGATILNKHLQLLSPQPGISGIYLLAESHISIHTWPQSAYAAIDIFMCGSADAFKAADSLTAAFYPAQVERSSHLRGQFAS